MGPVVSFFKDEILPKEKTEVEKIQKKAPRYWLSEEQKLYKWLYSKPYLLCVHPEVVEALMEELHKGMCDSHTRGRSLSHRALTQGYWWPSMQSLLKIMSGSVINVKDMPRIFINPGGP